MLFSSIFFGLLSFSPDYMFNRTRLIGIQPYKRYSQPPHPFTIIMDILNGVSSILIIIWGFLTVEWWACIVLLLLSTTISGYIVTMRTAGFFWFIKNITTAIAVTITIIALTKY